MRITRSSWKLEENWGGVNYKFGHLGKMRHEFTIGFTPKRVVNIFANIETFLAVLFTNLQSKTKALD